MTDSGSVPADVPAHGARGATVWLTGIPASGKTTLATRLASAVAARGCDARRIDGDDLRRTVCRDLGFSREDRAENVRRAGFQAVEQARAGRLVIVSLVSPYADDRRRVRGEHEEAGVLFVEVHVDCGLSVAEARDPKGLYARARAGEIKGLTGYDDPYEAPTAPEVTLDTSRETPEESTRKLLEWLVGRGVVARQ